MIIIIIMKGILTKFVISEEFIALVALRINQYPRSSSQLKKKSWLLVFQNGILPVVQQAVFDKWGHNASRVHCKARCTFLCISEPGEFKPLRSKVAGSQRFFYFIGLWTK